MTPEGKVKEKVKAYLKEIGAYYFMPVQQGFGMQTLDFLICHNGRFYGIETKREGVYEPTPRQALTISDITHAGGACCVESYEDLRNVKRMIF